MPQKITRKNFLQNTGKAIIGAAAGASTITALSGSSSNYELPTLPFEYKFLDIDEVRKLTYNSKHKLGCGYAGFNGIVGLLQKEIGEPYTNIPTEMMAYGGAGVKGWGTLCGALNGTAAAISLVCEPKAGGKIINKLMQWYTETKFPSDISNEYAIAGKYETKGIGVALPQSISGSPLCHVSVTKWCNESGYDIGSEEQNERCVRLSADVVAKAVELINDNYRGEFNAVLSPAASVSECKTCHGHKGEVKNASGKMECIMCHDDPHVE